MPKGRFFREHLHGISSLARGFFTSATVIYTSTVFLQQAGSKSYSSLVFYAFMVASLLYSVFLLVNRSKMTFTFISFLSLFLLSGIISIFAPQDPTILYAYAAAAMVLDIIGINVITSLMDPKMNLQQYREMVQKINYFEIIGRVVAAVIMGLIANGKYFWVYASLAFVSGMTHMICLTYQMKEVKALDSDSESRATLKEGLRSSLQFVMTNPLARVALVGAIWFRISKFSVECVFYQSLSQYAGSPVMMAQIVSWSTTAILVLNFLCQQFLLPRMNRRLSLGSLFSILPIGILIIGSICLLTNSFYSALAMMLFGQIAFRAIYFPAIRQCLVPVPTHLSHIIMSLVVLVSLISNIFVSGVMTRLKDVWEAPQFTVFLLVLSAGLLFYATQLDTFYIRNLWNKYREVSNKAVNAAWKELGFDREHAEDSALKESDFSRDDWQSRLQLKYIRHIYEESYDSKEIEGAYRLHRSLLKDPNPQAVLAGLELLFEMGLPECAGQYEELLTSEFTDVRLKASNCLEVEGFFAQLSPEHHMMLSASLKKRLRFTLLRVVESSHWEAAKPRFARLLEIPSQRVLNKWIESISKTRNIEDMMIALECLNTTQSQENQVNLLPLLKVMCTQKFSEAKELRRLWIELHNQRSRRKLKRFLQVELNRLKNEQFNIWDAMMDSTQEKFHYCLHLLFLAEVDSERSPEFGEFYSNSIEPLEAVSREEKGKLVELHLEKLKKLSGYEAWTEILKEKKSVTG